MQTALEECASKKEIPPYPLSAIFCMSGVMIFPSGSRWHDIANSQVIR